MKCQFPFSLEYYHKYVISVSRINVIFKVLMELDLEVNRLDEVHISFQFLMLSNMKNVCFCLIKRFIIILGYNI